MTTDTPCTDRALLDGLAAVAQREFEDSLTDGGRVAHAEFLGDRVAFSVLAELDLPTRDERMRNEGRRQANDAIDWGTSCVACAARLTDYRAQFEAGYAAAAEDIARALEATAADSVSPSTALYCAGIARNHAVRPAVRAVGASGCLAGTPDHPGGSVDLAGSSGAADQSEPEASPNMSTTPQPEETS